MAEEKCRLGFADCRCRDDDWPGFRPGTSADYKEGIGYHKHSVATLRLQLVIAAENVAKLREQLGMAESQLLRDIGSQAFDDCAKELFAMRAENAVLKRVLEMAASEALNDYQIATFGMVQHTLVTEDVFRRRWEAAARQEVAKEASDA